MTMTMMMIAGSPLTSRSLHDRTPPSRSPAAPTIAGLGKLRRGKDRTGQGREGQGSRGRRSPFAQCLEPSPFALPFPPCPRARLRPRTSDTETWLGWERSGKREVGEAGREEGREGASKERRGGRGGRRPGTGDVPQHHASMPTLRGAARMLFFEGFDHRPCWQHAPMLLGADTQ